MAHMEDVLDPVSSTGQALYAEPYDPQRPVVCFDETSTQLLADTRPPIPAQPGHPRREDYEYRREGTRNLFLCIEPLAGWRHVAVTEQRTTQDFAHQMRWLVDEAYPDVSVVRVVMDNLNTHRKASLTKPFRRRRGGWSSTTPPSMEAGSTWRRSNSVSSPAAASKSASPMRNPSAARSRPWNRSATKLKPASTGVSASKTPEPSSIASTSSIPDLIQY